MKKTVGMLCGLTILSACGTSLDFWSGGQKSLVSEPRHQPMLNGAPQSAPMSDISTPAAKTMSVAAKAQMPMGYKLVPSPILGQKVDLPIKPSLVADSSVSADGRRMPDFNRNALGRGPSDVLGAVPPPSVSVKSLMASNEIVPPAPKALPLAPVQKIQSVAQNMPVGMIVPVGPAKNAKPLIAIPEAKQVAKAEPAIHDTKPLQSVADNMPVGMIVPVVPAARIVEDKKPQLHDTAPLQSVAENMPQGPVVPVVPAAKKPELHIHDTAPVQSVADNMPAGMILPAIPSAKPAPVEERKPGGPTVVVSAEDNPEIRNVAPVQSVAENMPKGKVVPDAKKVQAKAEIHEVAPLEASADSMPKGKLVPEAKQEVVFAAPMPEVKKVEVKKQQVVADVPDEFMTPAQLPKANVEATAPKLVAQASEAMDILPPPGSDEPTIRTFAPMAPKPADLPAPATQVEPVKMVKTEEAPAPMFVKTVNVAEAPATMPIVAPAPVKIAKAAEAPIIVADNSKYDKYPELAAIPPAPAVPQPAANDSRVKELKAELKKNKSEDNGNAMTVITPSVPEAPKVKPAPAPIPMAAMATPVPPKPAGITPKGPIIVVTADDSDSNNNELPLPAPSPKSDVTAAPVAPVKSTQTMQPLPDIIQATNPTPAPPAASALPPIASATAPAVAPVAPPAAQPLTHAAPAGYLAPPSATTITPQTGFVPIHQGTSAPVQANNVEDSPADSSGAAAFQPVSPAHNGTLAPSRYERLRTNQNGSGY